MGNDNFQADTSPESTETDYYALDDTLAGRLVQAGLVGAAVAVPDYVPAGEGARTWARVGVIVSGVIAAALANYYDENDEDDEEAAGNGDGDPAQLVDDMPADSLLKTAEVIAAVTAGATVVGWGAGRVTQKAADMLRGRGLRKPWTLFGVLAGGAVWVASEVQARDTAKRAEHV